MAMCPSQFYLKDTVPRFGKSTWRILHKSVCLYFLLVGRNHSNGQKSTFNVICHMQVSWLNLAPSFLGSHSSFQVRPPCPCCHLSVASWWQTFLCCLLVDYRTFIIWLNSLLIHFIPWDFNFVFPEKFHKPFPYGNILTICNYTIRFLWTYNNVPTYSQVSLVIPYSESTSPEYKLIVLLPV